TDALPRQSPALPSTHEKLARRVKPLFRLSELQNAAYAVLRGLDYIVDQCPLAKGASSLEPKEPPKRLGQAPPAPKPNILFGFLDKARSAFEREEQVDLHACASCGQVTTGTICAFCKLADLVKRRGTSAVAEE